MGKRWGKMGDAQEITYIRQGNHGTAMLDELQSFSGSKTINYYYSHHCSQSRWRVGVLLHTVGQKATHLPFCGCNLFLVFRILTFPSADGEKEVVQGRFLWTRPESGAYHFGFHGIGQNSVRGHTQ